MAIFKITTSIPATVYYYYEVEAENEQDAKDMVADLRVEPLDSKWEVGIGDEEIEECFEIIHTF
jgi:hypothetical protein